MVLGGGVLLHTGGVGKVTAVHHRLLPAAPGWIQHSLPILPDHRSTHAQHTAHSTHLVSLSLSLTFPHSHTHINTHSLMSLFLSPYSPLIRMHTFLPSHRHQCKSSKMTANDDIILFYMFYCLRISLHILPSGVESLSASFHTIIILW